MFLNKLELNLNIKKKNEIVAELVLLSLKPGMQAIAQIYTHTDIQRDIATYRLNFAEVL